MNNDEIPLTPAPVAAPTLEYKVLQYSDVTLKLSDKIDFEGLELLLTDIIFEDIAECPGNAAYPAGSGVVVYFKLSYKTQSEDLLLNELSEPYGSKNSLVWENFKINLLEVIGYNNPMVKFKVEKIQLL